MLWGGASAFRWPPAGRVSLPKAGALVARRQVTGSRATADHAPPRFERQLRRAKDRYKSYHSLRQNGVVSSLKIFF